MNNEILKNLWLNQNEIIIYKEILSIWNTWVSEIFQKTHINKSTIRYTAEQLAKKWYISIIKKNNNYLYTAENPRKFLKNIEEQKNKIDEKEKNLKIIVSYFEEIQNTHKTLPKVMFYEWKNWLKELYEKILNFDEDIYSIEDSWEMEQYFPEFVDYFIKERKKRKIKNFVICPDSNIININSKEELREVKKIDKNIFKFTDDIKITNNHISIISFKKWESIWISITDEDIAKNFKNLFDYIWKIN